MFGLGTPNLPISTYSKAWVEFEMRWLLDEFGRERIFQVETVLPTAEYFPYEYQIDNDVLLQILDQLCKIMEVERSSVRLGFQDEPPEASAIYCTREALFNPFELVPCLTHELACLKLNARGVLGEKEDYRAIAELMSVPFGMGVFAANATIHNRNASEFTLDRRIGHLPAHVLGYALGLFAWLRGERKPDWLRHLRKDAATACKQSIRYLEKTNDSLLRPDNVRTGDEPNLLELRRRLCEASPSIRLATMWLIGDKKMDEAGIHVELTQLLSHRDPALRAQAARTITDLGNLSPDAVPELLNNLSDQEAAVRAAAVAALGVGPLKSDNLLAEISSLLDDRNPGVVCAAAKTLQAWGLDAHPAQGKLLNAISKLLKDADENIDQLFSTLLAIDVDPESSIVARFRDDELCEMALDILSECREQQPNANS